MKFTTVKILTALIEYGVDLSCFKNFKRYGFFLPATLENIDIIDELFSQIDITVEKTEKISSENRYVISLYDNIDLYDSIFLVKFLLAICPNTSFGVETVSSNHNLDEKVKTVDELMKVSIYPRTDELESAIAEINAAFGPHDILGVSNVSDAKQIVASWEEHLKKQLLDENSNIEELDINDETLDDDYGYEYDFNPNQNSGEYEKYGGYNGWSDDAIDEAFNGDPEATWNVD